MCNIAHSSAFPIRQQVMQEIAHKRKISPTIDPNPLSTATIAARHLSIQRLSALDSPDVSVLMSGILHRPQLAHVLARPLLICCRDHLERNQSPCVLFGLVKGRRSLVVAST